MDKFKDLQTGMLVKRSEHWHKMRSGNYKDQIGMVVGVEFYDRHGAKLSGEVMTWPVVWWEGAAMGSLTHPDNVELYRGVK